MGKTCLVFLPASLAFSEAVFLAAVGCFWFQLSEFCSISTRSNMAPKRGQKRAQGSSKRRGTRYRCKFPSNQPRPEEQKVAGRLRH